MSHISKDANDILKFHKESVWQEIQKYLLDPIYPNAYLIPELYAADQKIYWDIVKDYPERQGKYFRPTLLILTAEALGVQKSKVIRTAAAIQLSEDWLLIHDDLQDRSFIRRGKPTLDRTYGKELALNAGDTLQLIMWKMLIDNKNLLDNEKTFTIQDEFFKILKRTVDGQSFEFMWSKEDLRDFTDSDWLFIADTKTAYYTVSAPMRLASLIANIEGEKLDKIDEFSLYLGRTYQLVDDLLDVTNEYKGSGQSVGSDVYDSKKTLLISHLLKNSSKTDNEKIIRILSKSRNKKSKNEVEWIIEMMNTHGSITFIRKQISIYKDKALSIFDNDLTFLNQEPARSRIRTLISFVAERNH